MKKSFLLLIITVLLSLVLGFSACAANDTGKIETASDETQSGDAEGDKEGENDLTDGDGELEPTEGDGDGEPNDGGDTVDYEYALYVSGVDGYTAFVNGSLKKTLSTQDVITVKNAKGETLAFLDWTSPEADGEYLFEIADGKVKVTFNNPTVVTSVILNETTIATYETDFSIKIPLSNNDNVKICKADDVLFSNKFNEGGNYLFSVTNGTVTCSLEKRESGTVPVYYSNSNKWQGKIYAYCWNDATKESNENWPGVECLRVTTNEYGEDIYKYEADAKYDRIIFNNDQYQTKDLALNDASTGFYGDAGVYAYGEDDYGKVYNLTLQDEVNLAYRGGSKKISIYTPADYSANKKYAVLVMFDAQNIFAGAKDAYVTESIHGPWAVDVAVTSLMKNRSDFNGVIILGIDDGDSYRNSELTMSLDFGDLDPRLANTEEDASGFYIGRLDDLGNFILNTALPYVNANYSTNGEYGICGSSSGGLAAYYLGLRNLGFYSYIGAFSPAVGLFVSEAWQAFYESKNFDEQYVLPEIFVYCGSGDNYLEDMLIDGSKSIKTDLVKYGYPAEYIEEYYTSNSEHTELWWRITFSEFAAYYLK